MSKKRLVKLRFRKTKSRRGTGGAFFLDFNNPKTGKRVRISLGHGSYERAKRQQLRKEVELGSFDAGGCEGGRQRLSDIMIVYLQANKSMAAMTRDKTIRAFDYLIEVVGDIMLEKFDYSHAEAFQNFFVAKGFAPPTVNSYCKSISPVFSWAIRHQWIFVNPFVSVSGLREAKGFVRVYEPAEFAALWRVVDSDLWRARILAAKTAGLRRAEVLNLCRGDIDERSGVIRVQPKAKTSTTWRWRIKDHDAREVPLVPELAALLKKLGNALDDDQPYLMISGHVYHNKLDARMRGRLSDVARLCPDWQFSAEFSQLCKSAKISNATFHDLRRTVITEWLESGLQPHEVMQLAGHSSIETTMKYYTATRKTLLEKANKASSFALAGVA
ncbi:site-specific tyrosine recombinase XerC [Anaerohalosphaera lusitana]|uniref:Site-specific tyrosine recombinase XerC n=1 Tax=Anaerohalosphaera lusitana TaxID=1936003 RepID=A0A1U9NPW9_9BACT|nr:site-specific integrase [Anaerohalosphaera lusitana]AQT69982.1 site-specific tyrosine recombinase XerC [Anaerohalosphaera lusitana]